MIATSRNNDKHEIKAESNPGDQEVAKSLETEDFDEARCDPQTIALTEFIDL